MLAESTSVQSAQAHLTPFIDYVWGKLLFLTNDNLLIPHKPKMRGNVVKTLKKSSSLPSPKEVKREFPSEYPSSIPPESEGPGLQC